MLGLDLVLGADQKVGTQTQKTVVPPGIAVFLMAGQGAGSGVGAAYPAAGYFPGRSRPGGKTPAENRTIVLLDG